MYKLIKDIMLINKLISLPIFTDWEGLLYNKILLQFKVNTIFMFNTNIKS